MGAAAQDVPPASVAWPLVSHWTASDIPDQAGRTFIVTGANSGIGLVTARELAAHGAHVVLAVRDTAKGDRAAGTIRGSTEVRRLDLADLESVREFAEAQGAFDVLINNAGVMNVAEQRTKDGFELQFGTNHLGHFALTNLLLPKIEERVVIVASGAHRIGRINLDDLNWEHTRYQRYRAYGQAKLANLLFMTELQRRLTEAGSDVKAVGAHPGWAATNLQSHAPSRLENALMAIGNRVLAQSGDMGALPTLYAATQPIPGDAYIGPGGPGEMRGHPAPASRSGAAQDRELARKLWERSEQLTNTHFGLGVPA
jgi:NAD(P)-dependent dehydrogenase (short-subunit alcohol dehydrogenase family)